MSEQVSNFHNHGKGHNRPRGSWLNYTVYDNKTDFPIIVGGTARECANAMGITLESFYNAVDRCRKGKNNRWTILAEWEDEEE